MGLVRGTLGSEFWKLGNGGLYGGGDFETDFFDGFEDGPDGETFAERRQLFEAELFAFWGFRIWVV